MQSEKGRGEKRRVRAAEGRGDEGPCSTCGGASEIVLEIREPAMDGGV